MAAFKLANTLGERSPSIIPGPFPAAGVLRGGSMRNLDPPTPTSCCTGSAWCESMVVLGCFVRGELKRTVFNAGTGEGVVVGAGGGRSRE